MALPKLSFNDLYVAAGDMSADITQSPSTFVGEVEHVAVHAVWTGTSPVGNLIVQGSNDNTNFTQISTDAVSGNSGSIMKNMPSVGYVFLRVFYDVTSGTGTLNVRISGKR